MSGVIIVTGAFGALGRAIVAELQAAGRTVAAVDIARSPEDPPTELAFGGVDLTDQAAVASAFEAISTRGGAIGGLVNAAGGFTFEFIDGSGIDAWERMYSMNLLSAVIGCQAVLPYLAPGSAIVNVGAASSNPAGKGMAPYAASKAGVLALTQSLADEMRDRGIRVNAIQPTILDTPANRRDMPDADPAAWVSTKAGAEAVVYLLSPAARAVTGAALPLSLGDLSP